MIEDKRLCPHCGEPVHRRPYVMSVDRDAEWPGWAWSALTLLACLIVIGGIAVLSHS